MAEELGRKLDNAIPGSPIYVTADELLFLRACARFGINTGTFFGSFKLILGYIIAISGGVVAVQALAKIIWGWGA